ncbi:hypothetical protein [Streptomyces clavifer]|uniref:hypothetical protein n=1 Tax=Streptomyces clavifer TaxID=68188 RepID=UPI0037132766
MLTPRRQLLPQVLRLGLGQEAAVLGLGDGQGVLVPFTLQLGPQRSAPRPHRGHWALPDARRHHLAG